jgi:ribonucleotide reductase beta subunit family protein with ferritin-like domain
MEASDASQLRLKPEAVARIRAGDESLYPMAPRPAPERLEAWREEFPEGDAALVEGAARLFPATAPGVYRRWLGIRTAVAAAEEAREELLQEEPDRSTLFPLRDEKMWGFRKQIERLHWIAQEVVLDNDARDLGRVTAGDRQLLESVLAFFGVADELVMEGIDEVVAKLVRRKEGQYYLRAQSDQECVHSEAYSLQIQEIVPAARRAEVFAAVRTHPVVGRMADWVRWWIRGEHAAADVFAAMAFLEGVLFSGFFAVLQHYKTRNLFGGVTQLNEFIARDERVHSLFWCFLVTERLRRPPSERALAQIAAETVALSEAFFEHAAPAGAPGITAALLGEYVRSVADAVLVQAGYRQAPVFGARNPFAYMDQLALNAVAKSNFFEARPTQYQNLGSADALEFGLNAEPLAEDD